MCLKSLNFFLGKIFLLHNKNSELMDVKSFNVTNISHFVKAELLDQKFFFSNSKWSIPSGRKIILYNFT